MTGNEFHVERFSSNLKSLRTRKSKIDGKKFTQKKLAEELGVSERTIINWESGKPSEKSGIPLPGEVEMLMRLCKILECDIDYLLGRIETPLREITDICGATGLNEKAASKLFEWKNADKYLERHQGYIDFLNEVIPQFPKDIGWDYNLLLEAREGDNWPSKYAYIVKDGKRIEVENPAYTDGFDYSSDGQQRYYSSQIAKAIEIILRKGGEKNGTET